MNVLSDNKVGITEADSSVETGPRIGTKFFNAIWDTGASGSVITNEVISQLSLDPIDEKEVHTANGPRVSQVYLVNIFLRNQVVFQGVPVTDAEMIGGDVLIGMDIIGLGDFAVTHSDGKTCMSFQVPSNRKIDFVKDINTTRASLGKPAKANKRRKKKQKQKRRRHYP